MCFAVCLCKKHVALAKQFEQLVRQDSRFDVTHDVTLGLICFRMKVDWHSVTQLDI